MSRKSPGKISGAYRVWIVSLFYQYQTAGFAIFSGFHAVEINAAGKVSAIIIFAVEKPGVTAFSFGARAIAAYMLTADVVDIDLRFGAAG